MTKTQYQKIKKLVSELEDEFLKEGGDITSPEFELFIKKQIEQRGFTLEELEEVESPKPKKETTNDLLVLELAKMKGIKGETGEIGSVGPKGPAGKDSKIPGPRGLKGEDGKSIKGDKGGIGPQGLPGKDADATEMVENLKWQIYNDIEATKKEMPKVKDWLPELKKLKKELFKYVDMASIPRGKAPGSPDWGMPDKGSYGTAIADTRYAQKADIGTFVDDETPTGTVNGSNKVFTIANTPTTDSLKVFVNGQRVKGGGEDYTLSAVTITFVTAPPTNSIILVDYRY